MTFNTSMPLGGGAFLGLDMNFPEVLSALGNLPVAAVGNPVHWAYPSGPFYPYSNYTLAPGTIGGLPSFDALSVAISPGNVVDISNVARYLPAPNSASIGNSNLVEGSAAQLTIPSATSNNGQDHCVLIKDGAGGFERLFLTGTGGNNFQADLDLGALSLTGQILTAEGVGASTPPTPIGSMTIETRQWTGLDPVEQEGPIVSVSGTGTEVPAACTGPCEVFAAPAMLLSSTMMRWEVMIPVATATCVCSANTEMVIDIHGNIVAPPGMPNIHFDTWTHGGSPISTDPCQCLGDLTQAYADTVAAQSSDNMDVTFSCAVVLSPMFVVTHVRLVITFQAENGYTFANAAGGKLKICP